MKKSLITLLAIILTAGSWYFMKVEARAAPASQLEIKVNEDAGCDDDDDDDGSE